MSLNVFDHNKNIAFFLNNEIAKDKKYMIFLDWDDTVIDKNSFSLKFRNENGSMNILNAFKSIFDDKNCLGFYILSNRTCIHDLVQEATDLKIINYLKNSDGKNKIRNNRYNKNNSIISVQDDAYSKISIIEEIVNNIDINVYFIDDSIQNIIASFFITKLKKLYAYYFPTKETNLDIYTRIKNNKIKISKYISESCIDTEI